MSASGRRVVLPGLAPPEAEDVLRAVTGAGGRADEGPRATTWRLWTTAPPAAPALAYVHRTARSGLPVTLVYTRDDAPWDPELVRRLSARSGGYALGCEEDARRSTWGLVLCHDGRVVRWRRQAQEPGTESGLGAVWSDTWGRALLELTGEPPAMLGPSADMPLSVLELPDLGERREHVKRPIDDPSARWYAMLVEPEADGLATLAREHRDVLRVHHGFADPGLPETSGRYGVVRGEGTAPPSPLVDRLRAIDAGAVLLRDDDVPEPARLATQARRLQSAPGVFVAPFARGPRVEG